MKTKVTYFRLLWLITVAISLLPLPGRGALVALYPFDGDYVNEVDSQAANTYATPAFTTGGRYGSAIQFVDDDGDQVYKNVSGSGLNLGEISIAFWVRTTQANWRAPWSLETTSLHKLDLEIGDNGRISFFNKDGLGGANNIWGGDDPEAYVADGNLHHIAWTASQSSNETFIYVDGTQVDGSTWNTTANVNLWMLGRLKDNVEKEYDGLIDEYQIYDHALSPQEVFDLWAVPEPHTASLLILGLVSLALRKHKSFLP